MKETARVRANRRNARQSTGPRTAAGKKRSSANALRHGLSVPIEAWPEAHPAVALLVRRIAGESKDGTRCSLARQVAEAQIDLARVRRARMALLAAPLSDKDYVFTSEVKRRILERSQRPERQEREWSWGRPIPHRATTEGERVSRIFGDLARELARLDRYERRALSRRRQAIEKLDNSHWPLPEARPASERCTGAEQVNDRLRRPQRQGHILP